MVSITRRALLVLLMPVEIIQPTFARAYNAWVELNVKGTPNTISAQEVLAWQKVKHEWRLLERKMDARYRGEVVTK